MRLETVLGSTASSRGSAEASRPATSLDSDGVAHRRALGCGAVLLAVAVAWYALGGFARGWSVQRLAGTPMVDGVRVNGDRSPGWTAASRRVAGNRRRFTRPHRGRPDWPRGGRSKHAPAARRRARTRTSHVAVEGQRFTRASGRHRNASSSTHRARPRSTSAANTRCRLMSTVPDSSRSRSAGSASRAMAANRSFRTVRLARRVPVRGPGRRPMRMRRLVLAMRWPFWTTARQMMPGARERWI